MTFYGVFVTLDGVFVTSGGVFMTSSGVLMTSVTFFERLFKREVFYVMCAVRGADYGADAAAYSAVRGA